MLITNQNQSNVIVLTLTECLYDGISTGTTTGYTMTLENEITSEVFSGITLTDTSSYTERYNKFDLTLTGLTSEDYSSAKVYLKDLGFYKYKIYYNVDLTTTLIEEGFFKLVGDAIVETYSYTNNDDDIYFEYEN